MKLRSLLLFFTISATVFCMSFTATNKAIAAHEHKAYFTDHFSKGDTTVPRFGTTTNQDNTGRILTWRYYQATDGTGSDTVNLVPRAFRTYVQYTAVDSLCFSVATTYAYVGDEITFLITNTSGSGHKAKFTQASAVIGTSSNWQFSSAGSSITLTSGNRANITFVFDGVYWVEESRVAQ